MIKIDNKEIYLNSIIEVIYRTNQNTIKIIVGRLFDYDSSRIMVDISDNYISLKEIEEIEIESVRSIRKINYELWR